MLGITHKASIYIIAAKIYKVLHEHQTIGVTTVFAGKNYNSREA